MSDEGTRPGRRRPVIVIGGFAVVVAAVVIVVVVMTGSSGSGSGVPSSPTGAAQAWIDAHLHRESAHERSLSCDASAATASTFDLTVGAVVTSVRAQPAQAQPDGSWQVPLDVQGPGGRAEGTFPVTVKRERGRYLVC